MPRKIASSGNASNITMTNIAAMGFRALLTCQHDLSPVALLFQKLINLYTK